MIPFKEIKPFILQLIWKGLKEFSMVLLVFFALVWMIGWFVLAPFQFFGAYLEGAMPLWVLVIIELYWCVPAIFLLATWTMEAWEKHLLSKGYTKS